MFLVSDTPLTLIFDPLKLCEDKSTNDSCGDPCQSQRASKKCHLNAFSQISAVPVAGLHWRPRRSHCAGRWQDQPPASLLVSCAPTSDVASADAVDGPWESHQLHVIYTHHLCKSWSYWHHLPHIDQKPQGVRMRKRLVGINKTWQFLWKPAYNWMKHYSQRLLVGNSSGSIFQSSHWAWKAACRR